MKKRDRPSLGGVRWFASLGTTCLLIWFVSTGCGKSNADKSTATDTKALLTDYPALRAEVVRRVQDGQIKPGKAGTAALPADLDQASSDGQVYLTNDSELVAFNVTIGKSAKAEFLLYTKEPLSSDSKTIAVGPLVLVPGQKIDSHWYQAIGQLK